MLWHDIPDSKASELDRLAEWYGVHSIHVKECRTAGKSRKGDQHLFIVLKTGSAQEFVETRISGCFLKNDEFRSCDRHALRLEQ